MGLDQYLRVSEYISRWDFDRDDNTNPLFKEIVEQFGVADVIGDTEFGGINIQFPVGYWRKVNSVHQWFVDNCGGGEDECQDIFVTRHALETLRETCQEVLNARSDEVAKELLPPQAGFFFGSTDIDEWYYQDLEHTVKIIDRCLASKFDYFEYQASW